MSHVTCLGGGGGQGVTCYMPGGAGCHMLHAWGGQGHMLHAMLRYKHYCRNSDKVNDVWSYMYMYVHMVMWCDMCMVMWCDMCMVLWCDMCTVMCDMHGDV